MWSIEVLLSCIIVLLVVIIYLLYKRKGVSDGGTGDIAGDIAISIKELKESLDKKMGEIGTYASDMRQSQASMEQMLKIPKERSSFGEISLETILSDQLPPEMFGIRKKIFDGKIPDAYIDSTVGIICIDATFPLDNYINYLKEKENEEGEEYKKFFIKDVDNYLDKIAYDYVCPEIGSAEFAFAYIPSEGIYYFLITEAYELLRDYTKRGVQVVSPLTLSHKIELIKAGVHTKKLSENVEKIKNDIRKLGNRFQYIDSEWKKFYNTHLKNAIRKAEDIDYAYSNLRKDFENISRLNGKEEKEEENNNE